MGERGERQLWLRWRDRKAGLPEAVEGKIRVLLAQLLRTVVEAERDDEETEGE